MTQLLGTSRMAKTFHVGEDEDAVIQNMLTLYKQPATIRDMKQVFFYVSAISDLIGIEPLHYYYNTNPIPANIFSRQLYYGLIGTTRQFNISDKVNSLLDIRVPKDKYVFEINLVECVIESDTDPWNKIPDRVVRMDSLNNVFIEPTYTWSDSLVESSPVTDPPSFVISNVLNQATKVSVPQTMYCRIRELSNGEPYNWSVTNSGQYSIDKSHQLVVRHGDINEVQLTLEFGHLAFIGRDRRLDEIIANESIPLYQFLKAGAGVPRINEFNEQFNKFLYVDYNRETFNVVTKLGVLDTAYEEYPDQDYPTFYKGIGGLNFVTPEQFRTPASNIEQPANRPPWLRKPATDEYNLQGRPLLFNQQASRVGFRFMVRVISLF